MELVAVPNLLFDNIIYHWLLVTGYRSTIRVFTYSTVFFTTKDQSHFGRQGKTEDRSQWPMVIVQVGLQFGSYQK